MKVLIVEGPETALRTIMTRFRSLGVRFTLGEEVSISPPLDTKVNDVTDDIGPVSNGQVDTGDTQTGDSGENLDSKEGETDNKADTTEEKKETPQDPVKTETPGISPKKETKPKGSNKK
jgi:hypothetical protein